MLARQSADAERALLAGDALHMLALAEPDLDDRAAAMSDLAELWWRDGEIERAVACIGLLAIAPSGDEGR